MALLWNILSVISFVNWFLSNSREFQLIFYPPYVFIYIYIGYDLVLPYLMS